ncbi:uncharacterized protein LOC142344808 [Convolutriloba macropyga]|uniref:uncharacterized protein LOC142344808 n=1 Tax=Convolutriloba macropyga TaxID=536237 RepID=UPI003F51AE19
MKPSSSLFVLFGLVCISKLRLTLAQYIDDGPDAYSSGGSGMIDPVPEKDGVAYKRIELKFSTKFDFSNSPNSADFLAEVVEQLLRALNNNGGPNPKESYRPAMIDINEIRIDSGSNSRGRRDATESKERGGNKLTKFRVFVWIPESTDVNDYLDRVTSKMASGGNSFFHNIKQIKGSEGDELRKVVKENELRRFAAERLPPIKGNNIETDHGHGLLRNPEPTNNGGNTDRENEPVIEVEYEIPSDFFRNPATLAALIAGALAGLLCTILCTIFVVYRMRKKDEGSYALDEPKVSYKYKHEYYIASATKEFFA